jgi:hypothetical protein
VVDVCGLWFGGVVITVGKLKTGEGEEGCEGGVR